ncbi:MAG TPA: hypothetical protein VEJ47_01150 [Candidatus Eremiobacteraceae bacterium]|nr:hypothetical protein [Candidatus Eremiobacteraceae bacterium]
MSIRARRTFLNSLILAGLCAGFAGDSTHAQNPRTPQNPSAPGSDEDSERPNSDKKVLESNDKDMKKKVEQLYQLASELKAAVEKTDSSKVLSLDLVRKAEEIEKLAHDIKNRSKG